MDDGNRIIPARSRREVMDWGLVLASQEIEAIIARSESGWELIVAAGDYERARATLHQYQVENRGWRWKQQLPGSGLAFHWGALGWVAAMVGFYYWTMVAFPQWQGAGMMRGESVRAGQWWRLFTAITLHENLSHLMGNAVIGFLLLGLAMARYGAGVTLLAAFLAGAAGNVVSLFFYSSQSQSLGASGMVMGALGLLSVHSFSLWRKYPPARGLILRGVAAGFLILVLLGFDPEADIVAHLGGFVAGGVLGLALHALPPRGLQQAAATAGCLLVLTTITVAAWRLAAQHT